jgi:hypothetical protein
MRMKGDAILPIRRVAELAAEEAFSIISLLWLMRAAARCVSEAPSAAELDDTFLSRTD